VGRRVSQQRDHLHHRISHRAARLYPCQPFLLGALFPRHLQVEEFFGADGFSGKIGVSYVEALREGGSFTIGIFGQSGFT
jgi:hypothetical protein